MTRLFPLAAIAVSASIAALCFSAVAAAPASGPASRPASQPASRPAGSKRHAPAPLLGKPDPNAKGYIVVLKKGVPLKALLARFERDYGIKPDRILDIVNGFSVTELPPATLDKLRWEDSIEYIEYDAGITLQ